MSTRICRIYFIHVDCNPLGRGALVLESCRCVDSKIQAVYLGNRLICSQSCIRSEYHYSLPSAHILV